MLQRKLTLFYLLLIFTGAQLSGEEELEISYHLDVQLSSGGSSETTMVSGVNHVSIVNTSEANLAILHFHNNSNAHFDPEIPGTPQTRILNVTGPVTLAGDTDGPTMALKLDHDLLPGDTISLGIEFETDLASVGNPFAPTMGVRGDTTIYNLIFFYPVLEFYYPDGWHTDLHSGAADPHTNTADYRMTFRYPDSFVAGFSGFPGQVDTLENGWISESCSSPASHSISAVLSNRFERSRRSIHGIDVDMLHTPGEGDHVDSLLLMMESMVPYLESWFGPCPSKRLLCSMSYSLGELAAALATTNYIVYQGRMRSKSTLSHELGHHWFAGSLIANENTEPWLNEGFSEFGSRLWYKVRHPEEGIRTSPGRVSFDLWNDIRSQGPEEAYHLLSNLLGDAVVGPVHMTDPIDWGDIDEMIPVTAAAITIYYKSSDLLFALQEAVGEEKMQEIMLAYTHRYRGKTVDQQAWLDVLEDEAGQDLAASFKTALHTPLRPDYAVDKVRSETGKGDDWLTSIELHSNGGWAFPLSYEARSKTDSVLARGTWDPKGASEITLSTTEPISGFSLDPGNQSMDRFAADNHWPRRIQVQPLGGLPSWQSYRIFIRPHYHVDRDGDEYLGIRIAGGAGLQGMPLTASTFRHAFKLDLTKDVELNIFQYRFQLTEPLFDSHRSYLRLHMIQSDPYDLNEITLIHYPGETRWYWRGGDARYLQLSSGLLHWRSNAPGNPQSKLLLKEEMLFFSHTEHQRMLLRMQMAAGTRKREHSSHRLREFKGWFQFDLPLIGPLEGGLRGGLFLVEDIQYALSSAYRTGSLPLPWDHRGYMLPFRASTVLDKAYMRTAGLWGISLGLGAGERFPIRPMFYGDVIYAEAYGGTVSDRFEAMSDFGPITALGIGIESRFVLDIGLYFPLWVSDPPIGEEHSKFRMMLQIQKNWL